MKNHLQIVSIIILLGIVSYQFFKIQRLSTQLDRAQCGKWIFNDVLSKVISLSDVNPHDLKNELKENFLITNNHQSFHFKAKNCTYDLMTVEWNKTQNIELIYEYKP